MRQDETRPIVSLGLVGNFASRQQGRSASLIPPRRDKPVPQTDTDARNGSRFPRPRPHRRRYRCRCLERGSNPRLTRGGRAWLEVHSTVNRIQSAGQRLRRGSPPEVDVDLGFD